MKKSLLFILSFIIIFSSLSTSVFSQNRTYRGLMISPVNAILEANRGDALNGSIRFTNDLETDGNVNITIEKKDFKLTSDYTIDDNNINYPTATSLSSWISLSKNSISVKKGESIDVSYTIKIPLNADYGGHYAVINFIRDTGESGAGKVGLITKIQFPLLLNINGNRVEKLDIDSFKTDKDSYETANVNFITMVKNLGNVHIAPYGTIKITGGWIGDGTELKFNPDYTQNSGYILPDKDTPRKYSNTWTEDGFRFGPYTATLDMQYQTQNGPTSMTAIIQFWIIPWKIIGIIIGGIVLLILIIVVLKKLKKSKKK